MFWIFFSYLEGTKQVFVDGHKCSGIIEFSAIIRSGKYRDELPFREELVAVFDDLMSPADEVEIVLLEELGDHIGPKSIRHTPVVQAPTELILVRIRPKQIAQKT